MDTIRELIIQEFITRAAVMRSTGSPQVYATDVGATVLRGRAKVDPSEHPCTNILPQAETAENANGLSRHRMPIKVDGLAIFGQSDPSVIAEQILGDLIKCFTSPTWDRRRPVAGSPVTYREPYAESIVYQGGGSDSVLEEGSTSVGAAALFLVTYWTLRGDPCAQ